MAPGASKEQQLYLQVAKHVDSKAVWIMDSSYPTKWLVNLDALSPPVLIEKRDWSLPLPDRHCISVQLSYPSPSLRPQFPHMHTFRLLSVPHPFRLPATLGLCREPI